MTNETIILMNSIRLMKEGVLKGTGEIAGIETPNGIEKVELPEQIHTFNGWKERGFKVKKGEKSFIKFPIWKYASKKADKDMPDIDVKEGEEITHNMFLKTSAFFTKDQVEPMEEK